MSGQEIKITIFGDICPLPGSKAFSFKLNAADLVIGNLECALCDSPQPIKKTGPILYSSESFATAMKDAGINAVSLANNHIRDCGDLGVVTTIGACNKVGISTFGAGVDVESAEKPLIVEKRGIKVAVLSYAEKEFNYAHEDKSGASVFDPYESFQNISSLRKEVDALVVLYHGGIEHYIYPSPMLQKKCRKMVESGADVVLCQHSHCIGTREQYQGSEILYGQGNSFFGYRSDDDAWNHGLLAHVIIGPSGVSVEYDVLQTSEEGSVRYANQDTKEAILSRMEIESSRINDSSFIKKEWKCFCDNKESQYLPMLLGLGKLSNKVNRLLGNGLVRFFYSKRQLNVTHNLIRCDAHREVLETLLEKTEYD